MIYCVDSNVIVWGIKKQATAGQEDMIPRAELFFQKADEFEDFIVIPTVVVAEILAPEPKEIRVQYLEILKKSFIVAPFDEMAALIYAEILHNRFDEVKKIAAETGTSRQRMKVDHMIIAIAIANNANSICTTDNGLKSFAKGLIGTRELPIIPVSIKPVKEVVQVSMFEPINIEADEKEAKPVTSEPEKEPAKEADKGGEKKS